MQYKNLGKTGLKVSEMCLGTLTYGDQVAEKDVIAIIESALAGGINFIDTANVYTGGKSEEIIGKALKGKRDSVVLATKVGTKLARGVNEGGLSRKHIMEQVEKSLRRLQTDYIDLYYIHHPDPDTDWVHILRALDDLVHQGKVRYIGCSNLTVWQFCKALWVSDVHNLAAFDCIQTPYNLLTRDIEYEMLPFCASEGLGVCIYNPLAAGLLTGKYDPSKPPVEGQRFMDKRLGMRYQERFWSPVNFEATAQLVQIAKAHGRSMAQFALAWTLNNPAVTVTLISATSLKQLQENMAATEVKLTKEEMEACDQLWQKLFRPARFFYGW